MDLARVRSIAIAAGVALLATTVPMVAAVQANPLVPVQSAAVCDPIDPAACLLPFPSDFFTVADTSTDTGRRINFTPDAMPRTGAEVTEGGEGKPVDPAEWNRNDGFSPGSMVMTSVPGIDLHQTWGTADRPFSDVGINTPGYFDYRDQITDIDLYEEPDAPIVIIDAESGERHPFWSEVDQHPGAVEAGEQVLIIRPAANFKEGRRYIVALRNLKGTDGEVIPRPAAFESYVTNTAPIVPELPQVTARRAHYQSDIFPRLEAEDVGIERSSLYLAWDFTIASEWNLAGRALTMRDDAFGRILGDSDLSDRIVQGDAPEFTVDSTEERNDGWTDSHDVSHTQRIRRVEGRITVPNYMDRVQQAYGLPGADNLPVDLPAPGSRLYDDPADEDDLPNQNPAIPNVYVPYMCDVVLERDGQPMGPQVPGLYGHGLLGERTQLGDLVKSPIRSGSFMGCAVDWWGMSFPDAPTVVAILMDISNFPSLADRAQQGFLNFMFAGRALVHPEGFAANAAFQNDAGEGLIDTTTDDGESTLFYDGNSQGGIMGGSLTALSPDIHRSILGVTGMNYSTLLNRSVDWEGELALEPDIPAYSVPYYENYRDPIERQIGFSLIQMLWDRGETNGFAEHLTSDPLPNTPAHEVMLQVAWSDHQVANISAEVEAATAGAPLLEQYSQHWASDLFLPVQTYPYQGSGLIYWDSGNATPPNGNLPPSQGSDPHGHPRDERASSWQEAQFILTGWLVDVCAGGPYITRRTSAGTVCFEPDWAPGTYDSGPPAEAPEPPQ